jgi:hypothetical protein
MRSNYLFYLKTLVRLSAIEDDTNKVLIKRAMGEGRFDTQTILMLIEKHIGDPTTTPYNKYALRLIFYMILLTKAHCFLRDCNHYLHFRDKRDQISTLILRLSEHTLPTFIYFNSLISNIFTTNNITNTLLSPLDTHPLLARKRVLHIDDPDTHFSPALI